MNRRELDMMESRIKNIRQTTCQERIKVMDLPEEDALYAALLKADAALVRVMKVIEKRQGEVTE